MACMLIDTPFSWAIWGCLVRFAFISLRGWAHRRFRSGNLILSTSPKTRSFTWPFRKTQTQVIWISPHLHCLPNCPNIYCTSHSWALHSGSKGQFIPLRNKILTMQFVFFRVPRKLRWWEGRLCLALCHSDLLCKPIAVFPSMKEVGLSLPFSLVLFCRFCCTSANLRMLFKRTQHQEFHHRESHRTPVVVCC